MYEIRIICCVGPNMEVDIIAKGQALQDTRKNHIVHDLADVRAEGQVLQSAKKITELKSVQNANSYFVQNPFSRRPCLPG